jgi:transglutaminase-like putative cysteine protease
MVSLASLPRRRRSGLIICLAAALTGALFAQDRNPRRQPAPAPAPAPLQAPSESPRRAGEFRVEAKVAVPAGAQHLEIWIPAPRVDEFQSVTEAAAPSPQGGIVSQQTDPESGNTYLHLRMDYPQGTITFGASWKFERRELVRAPFRRGAARDPIDPAAFARDLGASELVPVTGRMKARASTIAPSDPDSLNVGRAIYDEVLRTVEYAASGDGVGRGDALFALDAGHGDAADLAALFVGLARARGIPARFVLGHALPEKRAEAEAEVPGYVAWAEFFVPDLGWIPVDLTTARRFPETRQYGFGNLNERRIQFTTGRDVQVAPPSKRGPHNYLIYPYAELDGEAVSVNHRFTFKEK